MNLSKKGASTQPPQLKPPPMENMKSNGSGPLPLSYPSEPPDDENMNEIVEENVDVHVMLPEGKIRNVSVNANIPMMDLLVNLAATSRLNPASYSLLVLNEETGKLKDFKPNQTIGSLCVQGGDRSPRHATVQLAPKKSEIKKSSGNLKAAQPFETTKRFTVNLPRSQKKVLRISPATTLEQVRQQISDEKNFDPRRYMFQLPGNPMQQLDMKMTVGELQTNEINFVSAVSIDTAKSMPDLSVSVSRSQSMRTEQPSTSYMPNTGETKKKKGFFSFLKKDKKFNVQSMQADINHGPPVQSKHQTIGGSPTIMRRKNEHTARPQTMYVTSPLQMQGQKAVVTSTSAMDIRHNEAPPPQIKSATSLKTVKENLAPPPKTGKKRRAPPPPNQQTVPANTLQVEVNVEPKESVKQETVTVRTEPRVPENVTLNANGHLAQKLHSRNSSDSSGYHELTLSGPESPETGKNNGNFESVKLKTSIDTTSIDSGDNLTADSSIKDVSPSRRKQGIVAMETGSSHTLPLEKQGKKEPVVSKTLERPSTHLKKKKAPPPPGQTPSAPPKDTTENSTPPLQSSEIVVVKEESSDKLPVATSSPRPQIEKKEDNLGIDDVLNDLDDHLDDDHAMMMVENTDISVEEVEVDKPKMNLRPCAFVAPPPPEEPPPDDSEPVSYSDIIGMRVDTVDIGTETSDDSASFEPSSTKSSPQQPATLKVQETMHSRAESRTSMSSVNTIEDINMGFELAIAAGQEAMSDADDQQEDPGYKNEMAQFVERMSKMVQNNEQGQPADEVMAEPVAVVNTEHGLSEQTELIVPENSESVQQELTINGVKVDSLPASTNEDSPEVSPRNHDESNVTPSDYEVSEITYNFTVDTVPPEFQEQANEQQDVGSVNNNKELTNVNTETIHPFQSPDTKEKTTASVSDAEQSDVYPAVPVTVIPVSTTPVQLNVTSTIQEKTNEPVIKEQIPVEKPKEEKKKEIKEFVLTFDDLQSVDFSGPKKKKPQVQKKSVNVSQPPASKKPEPVTSPVIMLDELKSRFKSDGDDKVLVTPLRESNKAILTEKKPTPVHISIPTAASKPPPVTSPVLVLDELKSRFKTEGDERVLVTPLKESKTQETVKDRCSELSFSPNTEGEVENVLEEKSIVMMALPAVRTSSDKLSEMENTNDNSQGKTTLSEPSSEVQVRNTENAPGENANDTSTESKAEVDLPDILMTQYEQMQNQFLMWQQQLEQNQRTLANMNIPVDENSQQLQQQLQDQIQFQKQMMQQMQESMKALTLQSKVSVNGPESTQDSSMEAQKESENKDITVNNNTESVNVSIPEPPEVPTVNEKTETQKVPKRKPNRKREIEPKLDPREELMLSIRNFSNKGGLRKVKVTDTKWATSAPVHD